MVVSELAMAMADATVPQLHCLREAAVLDAYLGETGQARGAASHGFDVRKQNYEGGER